MKTKIEINGVEIEVEFKDESLSISVEKDGETIEDLMIPFGEVESEEDEMESEEEGDDEIKPFGQFEEEEDFEEESEEEESEEEEMESEEEEEDGGIQSFESFLNKK